MSFSIQLTSDLVQVDPGATVPITVTIVSRSAEQDRFEVEVDGIDPEWKAIPVPVFTVEPNETHTERFFLKPPRSSESAAGDYPFVVRVRSLNTGESRPAQGVLQVKPFHHLSLEISPKKGFISPLRKQNTFNVTAVNLGNTEHTLSFIASDPEDSCTFDFEHDQVTVGPGQTRDLSFTATPVSHGLFSGSKLIGFSLTGRSQDTPSAAASAQAQLEQRPFFSIGTLALVIFLGVLYGLFLYTMPRPPKVDLNVDARQIVVGKSIHVTWAVQNAEKIQIYSLHNGTRDYIYEGTEMAQSQDFVPKEAGEFAIKAIATKDGRKTEDTISITVKEPEKGPVPEILTLTATPVKVKLGQPFVLNYKFNPNVTRAVLGPTNQELVLSLDSLEITPTRSGTLVYTVAAYNANGIAVTKTISVTVFDESDASIISFDASPVEVSPENGKVTVSWQVSNAVRVELRDSTGLAMKVDPSGTHDFTITSKTTYTLYAVDAKNRPSVRKITVNVTHPPTGPDPNDPNATAAPAVTPPPQQPR